MSEPVYVVMHRRPCVSARVCGARGCDTVVYPGEDLCVVVHEARWKRDPAARDAQAELCGECVDRLGANARLAVIPDHVTDHGPYTFRGKVQPSF